MEIDNITDNSRLNDWHHLQFYLILYRRILKNIRLFTRSLRTEILKMLLW